MSKQRTVCFVAGRSGGHIIPGLTLAQQHKNNEHAHIIFFSTATALDHAIIKNHPAVDTYIPLKLDNIPSTIIRYPLFFMQAVRAVCTSIYYLHKFKPQAVISIGGYISIPVCLAARLLRIPYDIFELNAIPGRATTFLAPKARTVYACFTATHKHLANTHVQHASYPIRFTSTPARTLPEHFSDTKKTVFIVGGSQGSMWINKLIKNWITESTAISSSIQIIHQTGAQDSFDWHTFYAQQGIPAITFSYHDAIEHYYACADLIVCRSGAGTLYEIQFFGKQCITIPLETATTDHQVDNALSMAQQYPELFTVQRQQNIDKDARAFFDLMNNKLMPNQQAGKEQLLAVLM